jgi:alcohol dehydrogenase YqhD (iron-dependent ADH family)
MEHALSAHYDISHGLGLALLLPRLMVYTYQSRPEKYALMTRELYDVEEEKSDADLAHQAILDTIEFLKSVDRYICMPEIGIKDDFKFEQMADDTLKIYSGGDYLANPKRLYKEDIIKIFEMSMSALP